MLDALRRRAGRQHEGAADRVGLAEQREDALFLLGAAEVDDARHVLDVGGPLEPVWNPPIPGVHENWHQLSHHGLDEEKLRQLKIVEIEQFKQEEGLTRISALIWVERQGQKAIVIGKKGEVLKKVGERSRLDLERMIEGKVFLQLWVKVKEGWSDDLRLLRSLGHNEE